MTSIVQQKVAAIRRRVIRLWRLYAVSGVVLCGLAAAVAMGLLDYLVRPKETGLRVMMAAAVWIAIALAAARYLLPLARRKLTDLETALQLEKRFPQLQGRLSSAIAFLQQPADDQLAGSPSLRRAVVAQAAGELDRLDLAQAVDSRRPRRLAAWATAAGIIVGVLGALNSSAAALALTHLAAPWADVPWPHWNQLAFDHLPPRITQGGRLTLTVIDENGRLPSTVVLEYRSQGSEPSALTARTMQREDDRAVCPIDRVVDSLEVRARGGDHQTEWHVVEVVPASHVSEMHVTVSPPAYTGLAPYETTGRIEAWEGAGLELRGGLTRPVGAVQVAVETQAGVTRHPALLSDDGLSFSLTRTSGLALIAQRSGAYWIELADDDQPPLAEPKWELTVHPDRPPRLTCEQPIAGAYYVPTAIVPLQFEAEDDLGIASVELRTLRSDRSEAGEQRLLLFQGPKTPPARSAATTPAEAAMRDRRRVTGAWNLSQLTELRPGTVLTLHGVAADYRPQTGQSPAQRITIVTPDEMQERLAQRQASILAQLGEALAAQTESRQSLRPVERFLAQREGAGDALRKRLQAAEYAQRQIEDKLVGAGQGVAALTAQLLADEAANGLERPQGGERMKRLLADLQGMGRSLLPQISQHLAEAAKAWPDDVATDAAKARTPFTAALAGQDELLAALQGQLDGLSQLETYRRFAGELARIRQAQDDLARRTAVLRATSVEALDMPLPDLARVTEEEGDLARAFHRWRLGIGQLLSRLQATDPEAAETVADVATAAAALQIEPHFLDAQSSLKGLRFDEATRTQQQLLADLDELRAILDNRRDQDLSRQVKKLKDVAAQLAALQQQRQTLRQQFTDAARQAPTAQPAAARRLAPAAKELQSALAALARRAEQFGARRAGESLSAGAKRLGDSSTAAQSGKPTDAALAAQSAQLDLERAAQDLAEALAQAQSQLEQEQSAALRKRVEGLVAMQESVLTELARLTQQRAASQQKQLSQAASAAIPLTAQKERAIASATAELAQSPQTAAAMRFTLSSTAKRLGHAAVHLERGNEAAAIPDATEALARLRLIAGALAQSPPPSPANPPPPTPPGQERPTSQPPLGTQTLSEVKLLQALQAHINRQTQELAAQRGPDDSLAELVKARLAELAAEQNRLAELAEKLAAEGDSPSPPVDPGKPEREPDQP